MVAGVPVSAVYVEWLVAHTFLTVWHVLCPHTSLMVHSGLICTIMRCMTPLGVKGHIKGCKLKLNIFATTVHFHDGMNATFSYCHM